MCVCVRILDYYCFVSNVVNYRLHNWIYKWQDRERRRIIENQRPHQLIILLDYANRYSHWQQVGVYANYVKCHAVRVFLPLVHT